MARVLDKNGVHVRTGQHVERDGRTGKVVGTVGRWHAFVVWEGETDDRIEDAITLTTIDAVHETRRRRR